MNKEDFISVFEATILCANLDITGLSLLNDSTAQIEFMGGGKRKVNIKADSFAAIIIDVMKHVF